MNTLNIIRNTISNQHISLVNHYGKDVLIFAYQNQLFLTQCEEGYSIKIHETSLGTCFKDIPIKYFKKDRIEKSGYLSKNKILRHESLRIKCSNGIKSTEIPINDHMQIIRSQPKRFNLIIKQEISVLNETRKYEKLQMITRNQPNFQHYHSIISSTNNQKLLESLEIDSEKYFFTQSSAYEDNFITTYIKDIENSWFNFKNLFNIILTIMLTVVVTIITAIVIAFKLRRQERRINLIEGFLPVREVNIANVQQESEDSLDSNTMMLLQRVALNNLYK